MTDDRRYFCAASYKNQSIFMGIEKTNSKNVGMEENQILKMRS